MAKQYGLIVPNKDKDKVFKRPAIFDNDSDSEEEPQRPTGLKTNLKKQDKINQQKVLEEDPTVYQYDEIYDEMDQKRKESKLSRKDLDKKPKYISKLMAAADRRKKENERRIERQIQKERETEGDEFKDKDAFITSAYKKKLEEMKEMEEQERREAYLESIGDVTKQVNLDGFYRHLYDQKVNQSEEQPESCKKEKDDRSRKDSDGNGNKDSDDEKTDVTQATKGGPKCGGKMNSESGSNHNEKIGSKAGSQRSQRKYRSNKESDKSEDEQEEEIKKEHLPSNLDADSDFSIDSSDSDDEKEQQEETKEAIAAPVEDKTTEQTQQETKEEKNDEVKDGADEEKPEPKKPKIDIWKKRTVGEVFDAALKRYYERKAIRGE